MKIFENVDFWILFFKLDHKFDLDKWKLFLKSISEEKRLSSFFIKEKSVKIDLLFKVTKIHSILLEIEIEREPQGGFIECVKTLSLRKENLNYEMGWKDLTGGNPYCLKLDECKQIRSDVLETDSNWKSANILLLFLLDFIGFEDYEITEFCKEIEEVLNSLNLKLLGNEILISNELEAKWIYHHQFGWSFEGEYGGCSLRSIEGSNLNPTDGGFPFKEYNSLLGKIMKK